jgi:hypothetical protein
VNTVFLSGKVWKRPEVAHTPKGRRILIFPMWIEEGGFSVEVIYTGEPFPGRVDETAGGKVMVSGELVKAKVESRDVLKVKASKIFWMEE